MNQEASAEMDHARRQRRREERTEVTTRMPIDLRDALKDAATAEGVTLNDFIIGIAQDHLTQRHEINERAQRVAVELATGILAQASQLTVPAPLTPKEVAAA